MSAQVTEAHIDLVRYVLDAEWWGSNVEKKFAQVIADSEATATAELKKRADHWCDMHTVCAKERDQLRAVFPKILEALGNGACCTPDVSVEFIKAIPNEVAEVVAQLRAEVNAQCLLNAKGSEREAVLLGRVDRMAKECLNFRADLDAIKAIRNKETARAERAEADLATAKAIIASIEEDGTEEHNAAVRLRRELATERARLDWLELRGPWDSWNGFGETGITLRENIRAAIDGVMKEGA